VHDGLQAAALDVLRGMASLLLSTFPTTVEEDRQQLAASSNADLQLALRFRIEKKRVLLDAIDAISHKRKVRVSEPCLPIRAPFRTLSAEQV
jgi:Rubisco LSMT substrate-binding